MLIMHVSPIYRICYTLTCLSVQTVLSDFIPNFLHTKDYDNLLHKIIRYNLCHNMYYTVPIDSLMGCIDFKLW